eukprot:m.210480 g.210480  ORF g.210480 m.210480 type:complete len:243 (-) comp15823_c0_seq28:600-1328(-)
MTIQAAFMLVLFPQVIAALTPAEVLRNYTQWYFQGMVRQKVFTAALDPQAPGDYSPPYFWERDFAYQIRWGGDLLAEVPGALDLARETAANVLTRSPSAPLSDGAIFRAQMLASFSLAAHNDSDFFCAHLPGVLQQLNLTYGNPAIFKNGILHIYTKIIILIVHTFKPWAHINFSCLVSGLVVAPPTGTHCYGFTDSINKSQRLELFASTATIYGQQCLGDETSIAVTDRTFVDARDWNVPC